ncbi:MAG: FIST C-terminal domain-containing protein [Planctomycetes bacterium]|nr:FIST C-terminal domain-containing protein [Planctomycetota bacterium]
MRCVAVLTTKTGVQEAVEDLREQSRKAGWPEGEEADLLCLLATPHFTEESGEWVAAVESFFRARVLIGCTAESLIGNDREVEGGPAVVVWAARMPEVKVTPIALSPEEIASGLEVKDWAERLAVSPEDKPHFIVMGDPFTCDIVNLLEGLGESYPGRPVIGGMASAGGQGENRLFFKGRVLEEGLVGAALSGNILIDTVVSQGCRPVGRPFVVTKGERNLIIELGGVPAVQRFKEVFESLSSEEQGLVRHGLHVGRVVNEYQEKFRRGDFLIRNVIGADQRTGAMGVTERVRVGQTIQFHVRDARSADEDLRELLDLERSASGGGTAEGALLFSCNGRGSRLFPSPHHDAGLVQQIEGPLPLAGFFAAGEIGPIGSRNFIHGFTASLALFRPLKEASRQQSAGLRPES